MADIIHNALHHRLPAPLVGAEVKLRNSSGWTVHPQDLKDALSGRTSYIRVMKMCLAVNSWHSLPPGSLPNNDNAIFDIGAWGTRRQFARDRDEILDLWILCSDGRLYHPIVAADALRCWTSGYRRRTAIENDDKRSF